MSLSEQGHSRMVGRCQFWGDQLTAHGRLKDKGGCLGNIVQGLAIIGEGVITILVFPGWKTELVDPGLYCWPPICRSCNRIVWGASAGTLGECCGKNFP